MVYRRVRGRGEGSLKRCFDWFLLSSFFFPFHVCAFAMTAGRNGTENVSCYGLLSGIFTEYICFYMLYMGEKINGV